MNGLKFIRKRCNYSQAALANELNVSRQAIYMWENSKKTLPDTRKKMLCDFFGLTNLNYFDEISTNDAKELSELKLYPYKCDGSEKYKFTPPIGNEKASGFYKPYIENQLSLDELMKIIEAKEKRIYDEIHKLIFGDHITNSMNNVVSFNRIERIFGGLSESISSIDKKKAGTRMVYFRVLFAMISAIGISFEVITKDDVSLLEDAIDSEYCDLVNSLSDLMTSKIRDKTNKCATPK